MRRLTLGSSWFGGVRLIEKAVVIGAVALAFGTAHVARAGVNVWTSNGPYGGTVFALAIDPTTPSTLYAGTRGGGVFQSTNSGGSWSAVNTGLSNLSVSALAIDPSAPSRLYAGTWGGSALDIELLCGNGALDSGEQCDEGAANGASGSCCNSNCTFRSAGTVCRPSAGACDAGEVCTGSSGTCPTDFDRTCLIPGQRKNACMLEWSTEPATAVGRNGLPVHQLTCTDDNPLCDFGTATGDNACTFHVALCVNVVDTRLSCSPTDVAQVQLLSPKEAKPKDAAATANRDALENALTSIGGTVRGLCANRGPHKGQLCAVNADCDSSPGSGDGVCRGRFVAFTPPLSTDNSCTAFARIQVPLKQTTTGFKAASATLRVKGISEGAGQKGHNSLKLTCKPHP